MNHDEDRSAADHRVNNVDIRLEGVHETVLELEESVGDLFKTDIVIV